jgi:hypothetical protein
MVKDGKRKAGWRFVSAGLEREWRRKSKVNTHI